MIVVKIEMWPGGDEEGAYELGRSYIRNRGDNPRHPHRGNYEIKVCRKGHTEFKGWSAIKASRQGEVFNWPRLSYNIWRLVLRALMDAFPEERA